MSEIHGLDCDEPYCGNRYTNTSVVDFRSLRVEAAKNGWVRVPASKSFTRYGDFCPRHKEARR